MLQIKGRIKLELLRAFFTYSGILVLNRQKKILPVKVLFELRERPLQFQQPLIKR